MWNQRHPNQVTSVVHFGGSLGDVQQVCDSEAQEHILLLSPGQRVLRLTSFMSSAQ